MFNQSGSDTMENQAIAELETYIRQKKLIAERIVPFSAPTLWRRVKDGSFPAPVRLSPGCTAWRLSDIRLWQQSNKELPL
jgi:prophage regulatory protein